MRCHPAQRATLRPVTDMQEPQYGRQACGSWAIAPLRHASCGLPEEEPGQAAE